MPLAADYPFLDILWTMFVFFAFVLWVVLIFSVLADNFRRSDHSGWAKVAWTVLMIVLPIVGVLIYLVARPQLTEQDRELIARYRGEPPPASAPAAGTRESR